MDTISARKEALRARMKSLRGAISADERKAVDRAICANVLAMPQFETADVVLTYLSFGAEVDTRGIIEESWRAGKEVAIPRCVGPRRMRWFRITGFDDLEKSPFGVEEPRIDDAAELLVSKGGSMVALVPALAFDRRGYRLGYGGGFYDTFLAEFSGKSIGLCRSAQFAESLDDLGVIGEYDAPVDFVATDGGVFQSGWIGEG